jgi:hypothetical protein
MRLAHANWQINIYGEAKHSLTGEGTVGNRTPVVASEIDCTVTVDLA